MKRLLSLTLITALVLIAIGVNERINTAEAATTAPTIKNVGTQVNGSTNITTSLPTYASGDTLLLFVFWPRGDYTIPTIANWTQVIHQESSNAQVQTGLTVYKIVATSSIAAPVVTLNFNTDTVRTVIVSFNNCTGVDVSGGAASTVTTLTSFNAPSVTTTDSNTLVLNAIVHRQTDNLTAPNTEAYSDGAGTAPQTSISYFTQTSAGATGAQTYTATRIYRPSAVTIALLGTTASASTKKQTEFFFE